MIYNFGLPRVVKKPEYAILILVPFYSFVASQITGILLINNIKLFGAIKWY